MLILISPAKTLDFETPATVDRFSQPNFLSDTEILVEQLQQLSAREISSLMKTSDKLGQLNASRYQTWQPDYNTTNAKQALLAFRGDVYQGMNVDSFKQSDFDFAQEHLRILSGLYGVLRPLDLIQPYRLEMGTKLAHAKLQKLSVNTLYEFWGDKLTQAIARQLEKLDNKTIVNLASNEYFKAIDSQLLAGEVITPIFKDWKNGKYKIISIYAKKARGMMTAYIIKNKIQDSQQLKNFDRAGYKFNTELSDSKNLVFTRHGNP